MNKDNRFKDFFTNNILYIIIVLVSVGYVFKQVIEIDETGKTIEQIIFDGAIFMCFGFIISFLFNLQGIIKGFKTKEVIEAKTNQDKLVVDVQPYTNDMDEYCNLKNSENLKEVRSRILQVAGMSYSDYFNENGSTKENIKFDFEAIPLLKKKKKKKGVEIEFEVKDKQAIKTLKRKMKAYEKSLSLKLTPLTSDSLIGDVSKVDDKFNFGSTIFKFIQTTSASNIMFQLVGTFIFAYYIPNIVEDFSWLSLVWTSLQVVLFISMGGIKYFLSYLYMKNTYAQRLSKQNKYLQEIINIYSKKNDTNKDNNITNIDSNINIEDFVKQVKKQVLDEIEFVDDK